MANNAKPYKWTKFKNGIGSVAIVTLDAYPNNTRNEIIEHYCGRGFSGQGYIEEVSAAGYDSWKIAAQNGLTFAFSLINSQWTVDIYKIEGRSFTDTNPTVVGYTAFRAFAEKAGHHLPQHEIDRLEEFVLSSRANELEDLIPDFFTLTLSKLSGS